jgi:predicted lipoprotein with Yx(FWY)xxD motif
MRRFNLKNDLIVAGSVTVLAITTTVAIIAGVVGVADAHSAGRTTIGVKTAGSLGSILYADSGHRTVYMFTADHGKKSHCTGACVSSWPPVTETSKPKVSGGAKASDLGWIKRAHGVKQVTYRGHPLYWFVGDTSRSTTAGQRINAFGGNWYVISRSGKAVKKVRSNAPAQTTTSTTPTTTTSTSTTPTWG